MWILCRQNLEATVFLYSWEILLFFLRFFNIFFLLEIYIYRFIVLCWEFIEPWFVDGSRSSEEQVFEFSLPRIICCSSCFLWCCYWPYGLELKFHRLRYQPEKNAMFLLIICSLVSIGRKMCSSWNHWGQAWSPGFLDVSKDTCSKPAPSLPVSVSEEKYLQ